MTEKPGAEIRRRLAAKGESQGWLALRLDRDKRYVSKLIRGRIRITPETAIQLAGELGETAEFWGELQVRYDIAKARRALSIAGVASQGDVI